MIQRRLNGESEMISGPKLFWVMFMQFLRHLRLDIQSHFRVSSALLTFSRQTLQKSASPKVSHKKAFTLIGWRPGSTNIGFWSLFAVSSYFGALPQNSFILKEISLISVIISAGMVHLLVWHLWKVSLVTTSWVLLSVPHTHRSWSRGSANAVFAFDHKQWRASAAAVQAHCFGRWSVWSHLVLQNPPTLCRAPKWEIQKMPSSRPKSRLLGATPSVPGPI